MATSSFRALKLVVSTPSSERAPLRGLERALSGVKEFVQDHRRHMKVPGKNFEAFEAELHRRVTEIEREVLSEEMALADVDAEAIVIAGTTYRRVLRAEETYMTSAGEVRVMRTLYKDRSDEGARALTPMELRTGVIGGFWTPHAAKQAAWVVAQMTPKLGEELFERVGNMTPSKSTLDRLPKTLAERWDEDRMGHEEALRETMVVPARAVSVAVSIDGVLAPMKDTDPVGTRARTAERGQIAKGPAGYREIGCATLSFCDADGDLISAVRMARMPEPKKATVKKALTAELAVALTARPDLQVVKVADGAHDNWVFLSHLLPKGIEAIDFFHAVEHLNAAIAAVYGDGSVEARRRLADLRHVLLEDPDGIAKVIRSLDYLRRAHPRSERVATELAYFRKNRRRMRYAEMRAAGLPVGSGVVEAACKTLVTQRLKQSGMRWSEEGGQAILNLRGWSQSDRFDHAWARLAATYQAEVTLLHNVAPFRRGPR